MALLGPSKFDLSDMILSSQNHVSPRGQSESLFGTQGRAGARRWELREHRDDLGFTRRRRGLALPAAAPPERFMGPDLLLSVTPDLWTSWNEPRGEGGKRTEGCLKGRFHTSPLTIPTLRGWTCNLPLEFCNFCLTWASGREKNCKLMTALKQALEEFWGCWGFFNYLQVEILRKGRVQRRSSLCLWQSRDWNVTRRELFAIETIQEPFLLGKLEKKLENNPFSSSW